MSTRYTIATDAETETVMAVVSDDEEEEETQWYVEVCDDDMNHGASQGWLEEKARWVEADTAEEAGREVLEIELAGAEPGSWLTVRVSEDDSGGVVLWEESGVAEGEEEES